MIEAIETVRTFFRVGNVGPSWPNEHDGAPLAGSWQVVSITEDSNAFNVYVQLNGPDGYVGSRRLWAIIPEEHILTTYRGFGG